MVAWFQGNQEAEIDFGVIPFQTRFLRIQQGLEPKTGWMVNEEVEEWPTHQAYLGERPRAAEMVYKKISQEREQDARKWIQQKEKGWKTIDYW